MLMALTIGAVFGYADGLPHALTGVLVRVDSSAKTLTVKTDDGAEHAFHYTVQTAVHDSQLAANEVKVNAIGSYLVSKEGTQVVVRYTAKGSDKAATSVTDYGKEGFKVAEGTIDKADNATRTLTIKTADGTRKSFDVSKDAVVESDHRTVDTAKWSYKQGDKIRVHYVNTTGKDIAHFIHKL